MSTIERVAIISPGEMGQAIGRKMIDNGIEVVTCLANRSERTCKLAQRAGIENIPILCDLVKQVDLVLSILPPAHALHAAEQTAAAIRESGSQPLYVDCNAVSISTIKQIQSTIEKSNGLFADASIIGLPPTQGRLPRLYVSGTHRERLVGIDQCGVHVKLLGDTIGQASGIKMCYAGLTKGTFALQYAISLAAQKLDLFDDLSDELDASQPGHFAAMQKQLPSIPAKSARWVGEMLEISETFGSVGVSPLFHQAAAEIYRAVSESEFGKESPETIDTNRNLAQTIAKIAEEM